MYSVYACMHACVCKVLSSCSYLIYVFIMATLRGFQGVRHPEVICYHLPSAQWLWNSLVASLQNTKQGPLCLASQI